MTDLNIDDISILEDSEIAQVKKGLVNPKDFSLPLYLLNLNYSQESIFALLPNDVQTKKGDFVVVPTKYGLDIARVCGEIKSAVQAAPEEIITIIRAATEKDLETQKENLKKAEEAAKIFKEKVRQNSLDMKFITCHFMLEEPKAVFFFSADSRIDFRKLVKDLVSIFKMRVELRQIGVRDESRIIGGLGCCGRPYCCHSITDKVQPVSIKMAKEQNISLNSTKISGQCGRLLCCLAYEYCWYADIRKKMPPEGIKLPYDGTIFKIAEINPLTGMISLLGEDGRMLTIPSSRIKKNNGIWKII